MHDIVGVGLSKWRSSLAGTLHTANMHATHILWSSIPCTLQDM